MGPCMCGDPYCPSCGPAQGNYRCIHCGKWSMDGGCDDPDACAEEDRKMCDDMIAEIEQEKRHADEIEACFNQREEA
jgi:hypothetical protein